MGIILLFLLTATILYYIKKGFFVQNSKLQILLLLTENIPKSRFVCIINKKNIYIVNKKCLLIFSSLFTTCFHYSPFQVTEASCQLCSCSVPFLWHFRALWWQKMGLSNGFLQLLTSTVNVSSLFGCGSSGLVGSY